MIDFELEPELIDLRERVAGFVQEMAITAGQLRARTARRADPVTGP